MQNKAVKIISCNVNGIRAAAKRGFLDFVKKEKPDICCLQEIKADQTNFPFDFVNPASKKGYSGVAVLTKEKLQSLRFNFDLPRFEAEGRILALKFSEFILINLYLPHGGRQKENLEYKLNSYEKLLELIKSLRGQNIILAGDFNIAHQEIDLARPRENKNNIMFTVPERAMLDKLLEMGFVDSYRLMDKNPGNYTWWPYAFSAKERNIGWRIDYFFISQSLVKRVKSAKIYPEINISDHCPIGIEI